MAVQRRVMPVCLVFVYCRSGLRLLLLGSSLYPFCSPRERLHGHMLSARFGTEMVLVEDEKGSSE